MKKFILTILLGVAITAIASGGTVATADTAKTSCKSACCGTEVAAGPSAEQSKPQKSPAAAKRSTRKAADKTYVCPMHADVVSEKPGTCPKCRMALVLSKTDSSSTANVDMKLKMRLISEGKYDCCVVDPCNACTSHGGCACREAVKKGRAVCGECYDGWKAGHGDVPGKSLKDIKRGHDH